ncbi:hypothetical protein QKC54_gp0630 [Megavirus baoshan]|uniref:Uncharacterized protein n=1 Tax=Megavirus baoshan TaxID=2496520 RepID=A0A3S5HL84_9VIRU|nr:hypothetical protein QKC54_gp0630 [Megavirus baoshan]AZL89206.1 hypothetical protein Mb0442 [Megavirus baoshan]
MSDFISPVYITVGVISQNIDTSISFLKNNIYKNIKISKNFKLIIEPVTSDNYSNYNYLFFFTNIKEISQENTVTDIKLVINKIEHQHNHIYIIVDGCQKLKYDDDGDLVFINEKTGAVFYKLDEHLSKIFDDKLFDVCKISINNAIIYKTILDDNSIVNLSQDQIDVLSAQYIKSNSGMSSNDIKKNIKSIIKKLDIDEKLSETGYNELCDVIVPRFKLVQQKKIVCLNYLHAIKFINFEDDEGFDKLANIINEINNIDYMKSEMYNNLLSDIDQELSIKINYICSPDSINTINIANKYQILLNKFKNLNLDNHYPKFFNALQSILSQVNNYILEKHSKEIQNITDLTKITNIISSQFEQQNNVTNISNLFTKIMSNPKIIQENIDKNDKWIILIDKLIEINISKQIIIEFIEKLIMSKALYYGDITRCSNIKDYTILYPQCLNIFLLSNINKNFIFKRLYMFLTYSIRYSGKNIADYIRSINQNEYDNLLVIENKLLELCS